MAQFRYRCPCLSGHDGIALTIFDVEVLEVPVCRCLRVAGRCAGTEARRVVERDAHEMNLPPGPPRIVAAYFWSVSLVRNELACK